MNQQLCDPNRLASFVRRELSDAAERELTAHLDECESCGQALEQQVAEAAAWQEASVFLGDRSLQDQEADSSITQSRDAQIEQVVSQLSPTDDPDSLGRIGGYEVTGVIGSGGMGVVLKARDHSLDRVVAVKVMAPHFAASGSARQRFAREAKAAAAVLHPNVIAIHGVSNEQALPYLVMPYVRGQSLQKRIDVEGPLPPVDILRIGAQVAAGLAAAHEQGLVHRDIKPGNILMEQGVERVTITDFGLARAVDDASMTRSGVIAGTPQYMSPEQARAEKIDHRSDLFSLGSVLYAMSTGHPPFRAGSSFSVLRLITDKQPRPIRQTNPDIPEWLCAIIQKLMAKDADDRFESAQEVADLLEKCVAHVQQPLEFELPKAPEVHTSGVVTTDLSQWAKCVFSNPEHQRSFLGRHVWPFLESGKVRLNNDSIEWTYNSGLHQTIPFSCIEEVAIGRYSRLTHPMRMDYLSIRYRDGDSLHTQLLTPLASWLTPVSTANAAVRRYADRLPQPAVEVASEPSKRRWWFSFVAASMFLWLLAFAGVLILLEWNTGTLRIESEVDDVPIRIIQGKDVVEELTVSKSGDSVRIAAGNYEVEIGGQIDGLAIDDGSVTLQRGGNDIVRIVKVAPAKSAMGDWPYGRLLKDLQAIKPPGGVPITASGAPISVAMGNELTRRLEAVPEGELDKWVDELERVTGDKLDGEMARKACRTYIVNRMSVLFDDGQWNKSRAAKLFFRARLISTTEAEAWKETFESVLGERMGQTDKAMLDGGPSYAVPLALICNDALYEIDEDSVDSGFSDIQEKYSTDAAVKYRKRLSQLAKQDIASWRNKVDRFGGTTIDAAMNIILLDDYFVDETFQDGDFAATLGGTNPKRTSEESTTIVAQKSAAPQTRLDFEAHPQDVIALQIGPTKHNKSLEWTSVATEMGPFSATITDEKVRIDDGSWGPGFTFTTQDADGRTSTSYIAMAEGGPLPIGKFYLYRYKPNTLLDLENSVKIGEIKYSDGTSAPVSVTARAANDTMVALPVRVASTGETEAPSANQTSISPRRKAVNNLTRIAHALHRYHELHGHFPPATILGKDGKGGPPHSWRVELLPLLGYGRLYDRYNFKAAWDSQRNLAVLAQMPDVYRSPLDQGNSTNTSYFGVVSDDISKRAAQLQGMRDQQAEADESAYIGDGAVQPEYEQYTPEATVFWKQRGASFRDMLDGTSHCIAVVEAKRDVPWTKPEDIEYSADQPLPKFGGCFEQGVHAAFADGTVKFLANHNDEQTIRNLLTISDGQPVEPLLVRRLRIHGAIAIPDVYSEVNASRKTYRVPDGPLLWLQPEQQSVITEADIVEVAITPGPNNSNAGEIVSMTLTEEAGKRFFEATTRLSEQDVNGYMLITFDRKFLTAPKVRTPVGNKLTITGNIDAKALAEQIQAAMDEVDSGRASPAANADDNNPESIQQVPQHVERARKADTNPINLAHAMESGAPIPDTPTIEEATRQFNLQSAADRRNLFDPPIGVLSVQQMRDAFTKTASVYREIGEHTIADSLQSVAETGKLPSDAISPVYASGPYGKDENGKLTHKQIVPILVLPDGRGGARLVPLRSAELIYNKHGRSSKRYGDSFEESRRNNADRSTDGKPRASVDAHSDAKGLGNDTDTEADAFSKLAAMQDWVIAWDSHVPSDPSGNGRRLALLRGFADGRIVTVHGADAELVQTKIAPKEIEEWVRVFAAEGTKRNPPGPIESADSATPEPAAQQQAKGDASFGALTPRVIQSLIGNGLTVVHEGAHYDLMSFQPNAPRGSPALRRHRVAEFSDDVRQRLMQLVCRARLGGFDECLAFANAQLRARYPDTPVELKASDIHQLYSLREDVIEVVFRYGGSESNVMLPVGEFIVRRDSEGNWSVVSGMYFPDESTSERWSGGPNQSIQDDSKNHEDSAGVETWLRGPYGFLTVRNSVSLEDAIAAFNRMAAANEIGKTQEPLTTKEVIAAMRAWIDRKECSEETRTTFQQIIESNVFRPVDQLSFTSRRISEGHVFDVWEVRFGGSNDSTAWFRIRNVVLDSRPKTPQELTLWSDYKDAMAESFSHFKRGTSKYRSKADQDKLRQLSDQVMQSSVAEEPADVIDNTE